MASSGDDMFNIRRVPMNLEIYPEKNRREKVLIHFFGFEIRWVYYVNC